MARLLGIDVGTNSVGSAWVDTERRTVRLGVSVFPAGITDQRRPRAQERRGKRSMRRTIARKADRKKRLRELLHDNGLLPSPDHTAPAFRKLMQADPWRLRAAALERPLDAHAFGRVLVHLNQRRGWKAGEMDEEDREAKKEKGQIRKAVDALRNAMDEAGAETVGQFMARLRDERTHTDKGPYRDPVRNRHDRFEFHADRELIREEFDTLWERQAGFHSNLAARLTDDLRREIADAIFFQRETYWQPGTLGRCDLEPTDRHCPKADRYAQRFLMLEPVNRIRIDGERPSPEQRRALIDYLTTRKTATVDRLRKALSIEKGRLNIEQEARPDVNTDWFAAAIIRGVFGQKAWDALSERQQRSVNKALQKFTPGADDDKLRRGAAEWWGLDERQTERLLKNWAKRPKGTVRLSRRAIRNLLPYLEAGDDVTTAKQKHGYPPHGYRLNKATRRFLEKHPDQLPPAPDLPNPVVRKAIHEVRRHVQAHIHAAGRPPDRIVIELARDARQPAQLRQRLLKANRERNAEREQVIEEVLKPLDIPDSQWPKAIDRVLLARRQKWTCPYTGLGTGEGATITDQQAAAGTDVEIDHIIPESRSFDSSLNNKLVCRRAANRNKRDRTPREWLTDEQFAELETRLQHFKDDHPRAWANLHRDAPTIEGFVASQLGATGYISREVMAYLRATVFPDAPHNVLCTKGVYTAILRRDWGLVEKDKKRADHRHHALDAAVIACTDRRRLKLLACAAQAQERARAAHADWPRREAIAPPWAGFRNQVADAVEELMVSHRPERAVSGPLHQDRIYGKPVAGYEGVFTKRIPAADLTPPKLRDPRVEKTPGGVKTLRVGKGGIVRDPALRAHIKKCLASHGLDPDEFTKKQIRDLVSCPRDSCDKDRI